MKTKIKLSAILLVFAVFTFIQNKISAQAYAYGTLVTYPVYHGELQTANGVMAIMTGTGSGAGTALTALGVNQNNPQYILDIVGNYTGDGVNVSSGSNQVGYSIGVI